MTEIEHINVASVLGIWWKAEKIKRIPHLIYEGSESSLSEYLKTNSKKVQDTEIINIFVQVVNGLLQLQKRGIHASVSPSRVTVSKRRRGKLQNVYKLIVDEDGCSIESFWEELLSNADENSALHSWDSSDFTSGSALSVRTNFQKALNVHKKEIELSMEEFLAFANDGDYFFHNSVANCYSFGRGVEENKVKAAEYYLLSANQGYPVAQYNLALCYSEGEGVEQDMEKAVEWFTLSAKQGHANAQFELANCYINGEGVKMDKEKAVEWYSLSANQGNSDAQYSLGDCYEYGEGVKEDVKKAAQWYTLAANQGDSDAQYTLGKCYQKGRGVDKDLKKGAELYTLAANQDLACAQCSLGFCYELGKGVKKDQQQAAEWFLLAAEQGDPLAQVSIAECYETGAGVVQDMKKAAKWLMCAADQGHSSAQFNLANKYWKGEGVKMDLKKAMDLYIPLANGGDPDAQYSLAFCYFQGGEGVEVDQKQAVKYFTLAAEQGNAEAQYNLALCYDNGEGVGKNMNKAVEFYTKSANQGYAAAQFALGVCYEMGQGVELNMEKAVEWFTLAANQNNAIAQFTLGECYEYGDGVEINKERAQELYQLCVNPIEPRNVENFKILFGVYKKLMKKCNVVGKLGDGGEGVVLKVAIGGETCALKMITNFHQHEKATLEHNFQNEWKILERLRPSKYVIKALRTFVSTPTQEMMRHFHPSIQCFLSRQVGFKLHPVETQFFILEFHPTDLEQHMLTLRSSNQLAWSRIFKYSLQLLKALEHLFEQEVVHNDTKMSNILVSKEDSIVLNDFGVAFIAKHHRADRKHLESGNRMCKAPEVHNKIANEEADIDVTKQYSWEAGCLLYEIAFGRFPFINEDEEFYPFGFGETGRITVPEVQFPDVTGADALLIGKYNGLIRLLLQNDENQRIHISDACLQMDDIYQNFIGNAGGL